MDQASDPATAGESQILEYYIIITYMILPLNYKNPLFRRFFSPERDFCNVFVCVVCYPALRKPEIKI